MKTIDVNEAPLWWKMLMLTIERVGFPIAVCVYLGWIQLNAMKKMTSAVISVETAIRQNTETLKSWERPGVPIKTN